jgi:hypothetical protein
MLKSRDKILYIVFDNPLLGCQKQTSPHSFKEQKYIAMKKYYAIMPTYLL